MSEFIPTAEAEQAASITFNVSRLVEVSPEVEAATQAAITTVWDRHVGTPTSVNLVFANTVALDLPDGGIQQVNALYEKDTDTISLALQTLRERHQGLPLTTACVLHAAHEARHKVQAALGDAPPDSSHLLADGTTYDYSSHELEAWESSVEALRAAYPGQLISFKIGKYRYSTL